MAPQAMMLWLALLSLQASSMVTTGLPSSNLRFRGAVNKVVQEKRREKEAREIAPPAPALEEESELLFGEAFNKIRINGGKKHLLLFSRRFHGQIPDSTGQRHLSRRRLLLGELFLRGTKSLFFFGGFRGLPEREKGPPPPPPMLRGWRGEWE